MVDKIQLGEQWYILATSSPPDERRRVLKHNQIFALFDRFGDIQPIGLGEEGIYYDDTCFLSHHELLIEGVRPMYLNSTVKDDNGLFIIELMNPDLHAGGNKRIHKGVLHLFRAKLLWDNSCHEHLRVVNFDLEPLEFTLSIDFASDYKDIFEVRGFQRSKRGTDLPTKTSENELLMGYRGLDQVTRHTRIVFDPPPDKITANRVEFRIALKPKAEAHIFLSICCEQEDRKTPCPVSYNDAYYYVRQSVSAHQQNRCRIVTSDPLFNAWLDRSTSDLIMLTTALPEGQYPYAGLPWYSTTFGRDGILTAREYLWVDPGMAKGVLGFLAATQAAKHDPERDAEPGKIMHEARKGELAVLNEIPFQFYYGTVDATPLFVGLAGAYYERTNDLEFIRTIWPNILRALQWIDQYGDKDGDGFVEYARYTEQGLSQQGWKDSNDSVFHCDGQLAEAPIALCEVQGYVYEAKLRAAQLAHLLGEHDFAKDLEKSAYRLKERFNEIFWNEQLGTYVLALDGNKRQCEIASSNAGHTLWNGIATHERAARIAEQLLNEEFFCGWGIRTIPSNAARYNPMAYHNGSVWPHDNALIADGMARYGFTGKAMSVFNGLREASLYMDQHRMPELFCGFARRVDEGPTLYPVACSPQAWSAAAVFSLLQSCLGLVFDAARQEIQFRNPQLPPFLDTVEINNLVLNGATVDLILQRYPSNVGVKVVRKTGYVKVVTLA
jgi:glycogen debranching enzyme